MAIQTVVTYYETETMNIISRRRRRRRRRKRRRRRRRKRLTTMRKVGQWFLLIKKEIIPAVSPLKVKLRWNLKWDGFGYVTRYYRRTLPMGTIRKYRLAYDPHQRNLKFGNASLVLSTSGGKRTSPRIYFARMRVKPPRSYNTSQFHYYKLPRYCFYVKFHFKNESSSILF